MRPTADDLDGYERAKVYDDRTVVRILVRRTSDPTYPSGWRYTFNYGAFTAGPETLDDGTIRRYDNAHENTKGHELHATPDPGPVTIEFPGIGELYERFWDEIPKHGSIHPKKGDIHDRKRHRRTLDHGGTRRQRGALREGARIDSSA